TYRAIIDWRDKLVAGQALLRDIIDLDATYGGGPDAAALGNGEAEEAEETEDEAEEAEAESEEGEAEQNISLSAMEQELKPVVLETFDNIATAFKKYERAQEKRLAALQGGPKLSPQSEKRFDKIKEELVGLMSTVRLNNNRIEALVDQLYGINRALVAQEGKLLRLAEKSGVKRDDFLVRYSGNEINPRWLTNVARLNSRGWKNFTGKHKDEAKAIRAEVAEIAHRVGLPVADFKRIVTTVQKGEREASRAKKEMVEANLRLVIS